MGDENDYVVDDYDEELEDEYQNQARGDMDSDSEDDYEAITWSVDTSAADARRGRDIQGIPWDRLNFTREEYRKARLDKYKNYENIPQPRNELDEMCKHPDKGWNFYEFFHNTRNVKPAFGHFQLRNLVWATSKHDVYVRSTYSITHWSTRSFKEKEVLNFAGSSVPSESYPGTLRSGLSKVQISTMAVKDNLLVAGGFHGELICKYLDRSDVSSCSTITCDEDAVTNAVEIYHSASGATQFVASSNDCGVRIFDVERFALLKHFRFPWAVNYTSVCPNKKLLIVVGDDAEGFLSDCQTGKTVATLSGHLDYSFASAWHPDGRIFATGNQDMTCRLWDIRNLSSSFAVLKGHLAAIRSIRFSSDGQFMAMAESADFVHIYDTKHDYNRCQEIDFFGEITGISFSPDNEVLLIGVFDRTYPSLLEYRRGQKAHVNQLQSQLVTVQGQIETERELLQAEVDEMDDLRAQMAQMQQDRDAARDQLKELQLVVDQLIEDVQQEASKAAYYRAQLRCHAPTVQVPSFSEYTRLQQLKFSRGQPSVGQSQPVGAEVRPLVVQTQGVGPMTQEEGDTGRGSSESEYFEDALGG